MAVQIPEELARRLALGHVVLFAGAGMSRPQLPGWTELLERMLEWSRAQSIPVGEDVIKDLIRDGDLLLAAQELRSRMGDNSFRQFVQQVFRNPALAPTPAHRLLPSLHFAAILTTNYDKLIESAFPAGTPFYTQVDYPELAGLNSDRGFAIVKVHGDVDRLDSLVLGQADYRQAMFANEFFRTFLINTFTARTVLFLGCSLTDPDILAFLDELTFQMRSQLGGTHFALMKTKGMNPVKQRNFEERYGIRILGDSGRDDLPDIDGFLRTLQVVPRSATPAPRPAALVPEAEAEDIAGLLEAMGQRILDQRPACGAHLFLSEYKAGAEIRRVITSYSTQPARTVDLESLRQAMRTYNVDDGIFLSPECLPADLVQQARACGLQAYGRDEFVTKLASFEPYLRKVRQDYEASGIEEHFVPLKMRPEVGGEARGIPVALDAFVDKWLASPERNHLSLLGDFGTGKTWFTKRLAWRLAQAPGERIPVTIALRDYSRAYDIEQVLTDAFTNRFDVKLGAGFKTVRRLNDEGRLLLIFDGFDEMERRASDYRTALENFWEIAKLVSPRAKILLTCRTAFFRHRNEEENVLKSERGGVKLLKGDDVIDLSDRREFEVAHLSEFDEAQIAEALRRLSPGGWEPLLGKIHALPNIEDLAHRPVLLGMIAETVPRLSPDEDLNLATLYQHYTDVLLERVESIPAGERQFFVEELAWEMQKSGRLSVPYSEFPEKVVAHFSLKDDPAKAAFFERDIRTRSLMVRDDAGNYRFAHKSMLEFFVARKLSRMLASGDVTDCPLTEAIVSFAYFLFAPKYEYEKLLEGDMAFVPPGAFIFGSEGEANLRVMKLEAGFWMDRFPVTNEQFCAFLNQRGGHGTDGTEWINPQRSRIRQRWYGFVVDGDYGQHPVTGVTWHGAAAYAAWAGKRLPAEQEWEKAARGIDGRQFPWGNEFVIGHCNASRSGSAASTPIGQYGEAGRSPYGCDDMAGNVWEWTATPSKEGEGMHVVRGGSFDDSYDSAACAFRLSFDSDRTNSNIGFRCARD
ncbi:MAG: SUMF1/EgtB/PvdO family nonheme iron enzyme [Bryobacteraceae bacterium]